MKAHGLPLFSGHSALHIHTGGVHPPNSPASIGHQLSAPVWSLWMTQLCTQLASLGNSSF